MIRTIEDRIVDLEIPGDHRLLETQPLIQIVGPDGFPAFRAAWEKSWRKKSEAWSTAPWPASLRATESAALLVPVAAGRVGTALGKHPKSISEPVLIVGETTHSPDDIVIALMARWLKHTAPRGTCSAPPVVETIVAGRVDERRVVDLGVAWSLPPADGLNR